ncbi:TlpA family protein disulfide reductase [Psychroserpens algicola]|uniref:TlpA family protein disulfide reductase n=1 Tax=Psychroserpens algicola TaxID=1719034 RepID=A0ABT0H4X6_9FLAO|nr:TlpA disulfide reductase family protein [Psychroserpens algicola]MCK8479411.1 TlpA family protein disulfide reductase [Psychroserpens algicola]
MKRLIIALFAISIVACKQEPKVDYVILSGAVENSSATKATLKNANFNTELSIDKNGVFSDTIQIPESGFYSFSIGREYTPIYLSLGNNLNVTIDAQKFDESISYSGEGATENNYLAAKTLNSIKVTSNAKALYSSDETSFKNTIDSIQSQNENQLHALEKANESFLATEKQNLVYDNYLMLKNYAQRHGFYTKKENFEVSEDFFPDELKNLTFDDAEAYKTSQSYKNMAFRQNIDDLFKTLGDDISTVSVKELQSIEAIKVTALKNDVIDYLGNFLVSPANENMESIYNFFKNNTTNEDTKKALTETFEKNKDLVKGKPSPQFVNYENHKGGDMSLADLKGKYVYVDVWATWCGPCIREIPSLKEVEKQFHNENIAFVSTSIDEMKNRDKWLAMVDEKELGGVQLMADKDWSSDFVKAYAIQGIPRFILIDPNGNIVSADAPRPSDPNLVKLLEKELQM